MIKILPNWHPIFVHFTIALLIVATVLFLLSYLFKNASWANTLNKIAHINLWIGAGITIITIIAGFDAYNTVAHDAPSHIAMKDHRNWAITTSIPFTILAIWSAILYRKSKPIDVVFLLVLLLASGALLITSFKGGELVYRHGLGVMSLPNGGGATNGHNHSDHAY